MPTDDRFAPAPWTVERSFHVVKDRWISLRADTCRTREGVSIDPFYVLEYPDWVQIVAIDEDDKLILVEQYRHGLEIISLELPTGGMEAQDGDPLSAARRELAEENGLRIGRLAAHRYPRTQSCQSDQSVSRPACIARQARSCGR